MILKQSILGTRPGPAQLEVGHVLRRVGHRTPNIEPEIAELVWKGPIRDHHGGHRKWDLADFETLKIAESRDLVSWRNGKLRPGPAVEFSGAPERLQLTGARCLSARQALTPNLRIHRHDLCASTDIRAALDTTEPDGAEANVAVFGSSRQPPRMSVM